MNFIKNQKKLIKIFKENQVVLAYLFGSRASGNTGPLSDYDFAVYFDEVDKKKIFNFKINLQDKISRYLKTDRVDIVVLNLAESPELKYDIIKKGILIFKKESFKLLVEPKILNEYFDFHSSLLRHGLTKA